CLCLFFFFQAEDGIRDFHVTGVQTCALPIGDTRSTVPLKVLPGSASTCSCTGRPALSVASSRSGTLSVASSLSMSTMRKIGVLIWTKLPALIEREAMIPEIGALTAA